MKYNIQADIPLRGFPISGEMEFFKSYGDWLLIKIDQPVHKLEEYNLMRYTLNLEVDKAQLPITVRARFTGSTHYNIPLIVESETIIGF